MSSFSRRVLLVALGVSGCVHSHSSYHVTASRPVAVDVGALKRSEATTCTFFFLYAFAFTEDGTPHTVGDAMEALEGSTLVDVTIDTWWRNFLIGHSVCTTVSGRPVLE